MKTALSRPRWALITLALLWSSARAAPHIGYAYPGGGQQGTTFEVTVGGQDLRSAASVLITGRGVKAQVFSSIQLVLKVII